MLEERAEALELAAEGKDIARRAKPRAKAVCWHTLAGLHLAPWQKSGVEWRVSLYIYTV